MPCKSHLTTNLISPHCSAADAWKSRDNGTFIGSNTAAMRETNLRYRELLYQMRPRLYRERPRQAQHQTRARCKKHSLVNSIRLITCPTEAHNGCTPTEAASEQDMERGYVHSTSFAS